MFPHFMRRRPHLMPLFIIGGLVFAAAMAFVLGVVVMALWNWLMPPIFGLIEINFPQAWGLAFLSHILFKADQDIPSGRSGKKRNHRRSRRSDREDLRREFFAKIQKHDLAKEDPEENKDNDES